MLRVGLRGKANLNDKIGSYLGATGALWKGESEASRAGRSWENDEAVVAMQFLFGMVALKIFHERVGNIVNLGSRTKPSRVPGGIGCSVLAYRRPRLASGRRTA